MYGVWTAIKACFSVLNVCFYVLVIDEAEITLAIQNDARCIDRLAERAYAKDYARLGLGSLLANTHQKLKSEPFR